MRSIVIFGGTGLIGKKLIQELKRNGYSVTVVTRDILHARMLIEGAQEYISLDDKDSIKRAIGRSYGVINLSGAPIIGKRWDEKYKELLIHSRLDVTKIIFEAIKNAEHKPKVFISGSAVGYYGSDNTNKIFTENDSPGKDFLARLCVDWEAEANKAKDFGVRVVCIRTAIILDKNEGALSHMLMPFKFYIGGPIGSGKQYFPWIHVIDEVGILCYALENREVNGPINAVAPEIVTNKIFSRKIGEIMHKPSIFSVPTFILKFVYGEAANVITSGVQASSKKIEELGYRFSFPTLTKALESIIK